MLFGDRPVFTELFDVATSFLPAAQSTYVFSRSSEERSGHVDARIASRSTLVEVTRETEFEATLTINNVESQLVLRSERSLAAFWSLIPGDAITYIDITGLPHHVWASLVRGALRARRVVACVYLEPASYTYKSAPTEVEFFDLSDAIKGIGSLPGFASLADEVQDSTIFVPLLGFEGARLAHVIEQVDPPHDRVMPIVGVPGFRLEYPFHAYLGNRHPLLITGAWQRIRFAAANCPFALYYVLEDISREYPRSRLKLAPIGTKPHALGAVLFKIARPNDVELVYDFPIRKPGRTHGSDRLFVYYISSLVGAA